MDNLSYSSEAEDVMNLFYQKDYMVYVEGEDDICFWEVVLEKTSNLKFEIQDVGGCEYLPPYIEMVRKKESNIIVACDSDLIKFDVDYVDVSGVIRTYGYSIENTFITPSTILKVIKSLGKFSAKDMINVRYDRWIDDFGKKVRKLIALDVYNHINKKGVSVVGDNSDRFMNSKSSSELCDMKIDEYINSLPDDFHGVNINDINALIKPGMPNIDMWIRGHFLFSASLRYISQLLKGMGRKASLSNEALYSNLINSFSYQFNEGHEQFSHYKSQVDLIS